MFYWRETQNFILKFREIFLWWETVLSVQGMKSDEKLFFCQIYAIFWGKWYMLWLTGILLYLWKVWRFFLTSRLSLIVPLSPRLGTEQNIKETFKIPKYNTKGWGRVQNRGFGLGEVCLKTFPFFFSSFLKHFFLYIFLKYIFVRPGKGTQRMKSVTN